MIFWPGVYISNVPFSKNKFVFEAIKCVNFFLANTISPTTFSTGENVMKYVPLYDLNKKLNEF